MWCGRCVRPVRYGALFCPRCGDRSQYRPWAGLALALVARVSAEVKWRSEQQKQRIQEERRRSRERRRRLSPGKPLVDKTESLPVL